MSKSQKKKRLIIFFCLLAALLAASLLAKGSPKTETISEVMKDAVLHEGMKVRFLGMDVNPGLIAAYVVTGFFLVVAVIVRVFFIPKFKKMPGKVQLLLEQAVGLFDNMARNSSPHLNRFLGGYIFAAGAYIFVGTIFELFGVQVISTSGASIPLPAPLTDINGAIGMGLFSYGVILSGGIIGNGAKGLFSALKDFSLPISMSFRLFGALLSGALVTELVYYSISLSIGVPVIVGVLFTLLHALIQAYVLTMLVSTFYGESAEKSPPKETEQAESA